MGGRVEAGPWLEAWLSAERLGTYLAAAGGDRALALALYEWNTTACAAVLHDLAHLEVAVRNAYDRAWNAHTPTGTVHWTRDPDRYFPPAARRARDGTFIDANRTPRNQIAAATRTAGRGAQAGKVIAELSFGFWRYLSISARETDLWLPYLRHGFIAGTSRKAIDTPMARLHMLRNRVAHHEPLLRADLDACYQDLTAITQRINPRITEHIATHTSWPPLAVQRPTRPGDTRQGLTVPPT